MGRRTEYWCDECLRSMPHVHVQWSACHANRWQIKDFCSYSCATVFRARSEAHQDHGRGYTEGGQIGDTCPCKGDQHNEMVCRSTGCRICK